MPDEKSIEDHIKEHLTQSPHPETSLSQKRYAICNECDRFDDAFKICKECHCFMPLKVRIPPSLHDVKCPIGKW